MRVLSNNFLGVPFGFEILKVVSPEYPITLPINVARFLIEISLPFPTFIATGLSKLSNQLIFFYDGHLRLHQGPEYAVELITSAARQTGRLPVLCLDGNPCDADRYHQELSKHLDIKDFFIFHPDIRPQVSNQPNMAPWPSWWFFQLMEHNHQLNQPKKHRVSFLSGSSRYHRVKLLRDIKSYINDQDVIIVNHLNN